MIKLRPHITEKSVTLAKQGQFTLLAPKTATKGQILTQIRSSFKVKAQDIRTLNEKSIKSRKMRGGFTTDRGSKKVVIGLKKGDLIPGFDIAQEDKRAEKETIKKVKAAK